MASSAAFATTPITQCGTVINQPGHYELATNLECPNDPTKPAIIVRDTKHVTIHMKGKNIRFIIKKLPILIFPPKFEPPKAIGVLVTNARDVEIKGNDNPLSLITRAAFGVMARNAEDVKVEEVTLKTNKVGVSFQGPESKDGRVEESVFTLNTCDIQTKLGAESPHVEDSNPQVYCQ